ncbi:MAG: hypothetical protein RML72_07815, partial [Bacteroidia bacterium]|nr:hypothetical protein [Bacteroidia bacterium]
MNSLRLLLLLLSFVFVQANALASKQELSFIENKGQIRDANGTSHPEIAFSTSFNNINVFFSKNKIHYLFKSINSSQHKDISPSRLSILNYRIDLEFLGANPDVKIIPQGVLPGVFKYYRASTKPIEVLRYASILYKDLYPGVDLLISSSKAEQALKYDFILRPGVDPNIIRLKYTDKVNLDKDGRIIINHVLGKLQESAPVVWQVDKLEEQSSNADSMAKNFKLSSRWVLDEKNNILRFQVENWNASKYTIIDPIIWGTYHGGTAADTSYGITTDGSNNSYTAGVTFSNNFITTTGPSFGGQADAFLIKRDAIGGLLWSLYIGGNSYDAAYNVHFNSVDNTIMLVGATESTNLPVNTNTTFQGVRDVFLAHFDLQGGLLRSSYYGGSGLDFALSGAFTPSSCNWANVYFTIVGATRSDNLPGSRSSFYAEGLDIFVATFNALLQPQTVRYIGGINDEIGNDILVDPASCTYVVASVTQSRFLTLLQPGASAFIRNMPSGDPSEIYLTRLQSNLFPVWATYFGGSGSEWSTSFLKNCALAIDSNQNLFLGGSTSSTNLPTTSGAYQSSFGTGGAFGGGTGLGSRDGFVAKFNPNGALSWCSYYGGGQSNNSNDFIHKIIIDKVDNLLITGTSTERGFPVRSNAQSPTLAYTSGADMFLAKIDNLTSNIFWSTYLGAEGNDHGFGLAVDNTNAIYLSGTSTSNNITFPTGSPGIPNRGNGDAIIIKIEDCRNRPAEPVAINTPLLRCGAGPITISVSVSTPDVPTVKLYARISDPTSIEESNVKPFVITANVPTSGNYFLESQYFPGCASSRVPINIDIFPVPGAPIVSNRIICQPGTDNVTVNMGDPAGSAIRIYTQPTGGSFIEQDISFPFEFELNITTTTTFYAESIRPESPSCVSDRTAFSIEIGANLAPPQVDRTELCGSGSVTFTLGSGNSPITGMRLYESRVGGAALSEDRTPPYNFTVPAVELKTYYVESFFSAFPNECRSERVAVKVYPRPNTPLVPSSVSRCGAGIVTITANLTNGTFSTQVNWYTVPFLGTPVATRYSSDSDFSYTTPSLTTNTTYYVEANETSLPGCVSPRAAVAVEIIPIPEAPVVTQNQLRLCSSGNPANPVVVNLPVNTTDLVDELRLLDSNGNVVQNYKPGFSFSSYTFNWNVFTSANYFVESVARRCTSRVRSTVTVTILPTIGQVSAAGINRCGAGPVTLTFSQAEPRGSVIYIYSTQNAPDPIYQTSTANATFTIPNVSATTTYYIESFDPAISPSCPMRPRTAVPITINSIPDEPVITDNPVICGPRNASIPFTVGSNPGNTIRIYTQPLGTDPPIRSISPISSPVTIFVNTTSTYYFEAANSSTNCSSARRVAIVTVRPVPSAPVVSSAKRCGDGSVTFSVSATASTGAQLALYDVPTGGTPIATLLLQAGQNNYQIVSNVRTGILNNPVSVNYYLAIEDKIAPPTPPCESNRVLAVATWYPTPQQASIGLTPAQLCVGRAATVTVNYNHPEALYEWIVPGLGSLPPTSNRNLNLNPLTIANNGTVQVSITVPDVVGCTPQVLSTNLVVNDTTLGLITNAPVCEGSRLIVAANSLPNATYQWSGPAGLPSPLPNSPFLSFDNIRGNQVGEFTLRAIIPGCPDQVRRINTSVHRKPIISGSSSVCLNNQISLSVPNLSGVTYSWRIRSGEPFLSNTSGSNNNFRPVGDRSLIGRSFIVEVVANYLTAGCTLDSTFIIRINEEPRITSVVASNNNQPICQGKSLTLTVELADIPPPGTLYSWRGPGGFTGSTRTVQIPSLSPANSGDYTVTVTYPGCPPASAVSTAVNVTPAPSNPQVIASDLVCVGDVLRLSTNLVFSGASYLWSGPNNFSSTLFSPTIPIVSTQQSGTYIVSVTYPGCDPVTSNPGKLVQVNAPAVGPARTNQPLCIGSTLYLTAPDAQDATYEWQGPNGFTSTEKNPSIRSVTSLHQGVYRVRVRVRGCAPQDFFTEAVQVMPEVSLTSNSPLCEGANLVLTATQIPEATYLWLGPINQRIPSNHTLTLRNINIDQSGEYTVLTIWKGCTTYNKTQVIINPKPAIELRSNSPVCEGDVLRLTLLHLNPVRGATYRWNRFPTESQTQIIVPVATKQLEGEHVATVSVPGCQ